MILTLAISAEHRLVTDRQTDRQTHDDSIYLLAWHHVVKTTKLLKLAGLPQTNKTISADSRLKFTILWGHVEEILLLNKFFSDCRCVP